jgi:hypothetical protein
MLREAAAPAQWDKAILAGGLLMGALDIADAIIFWWLYRDAPPARILQSVASGLLGAKAYEGGAATAALGLVLHFVIATTIAAVYVAGSRKLPVLVERAALCGMAYGLAVYGVMNYVVLPLSAFPGRLTFALIPFLNGILGHALLVGLPVAIMTRRYAPLARGA